MAWPAPSRSGPAPATPATLPDLLRLAGDAYPNGRALSQRDAGYWRHWATEDVQREVRRLALGLVKLGVQPGDTVGLIAPGCPAWLVADLAVLSIGAVSVPLFPNLAREHLAYELDHARVRALIVLGDAAATAVASLPTRRLVITRHVAAGLIAHAHDWAMVTAQGDTLGNDDPSLLPRLRAAVQPNSLATIIYTSGSTGTPKGVELTHANLVSQVRGALTCYPLDPARDRALSCLPLAHVFERMVAYTYLAAGVPIWFADDIAKVGGLLREVKPTVMTMVPRLVEKLYDRIAAGVDAAWAGKRALGRWALRKAKHDDPEAPQGLATRVADGLIYQKVRGAMGGSLRMLIVGGAALAPDFERFLRNIGVPVYVGYGLTESAPVLACNRPGARRTGTVGPAFPGVELRLGLNDEILARGPNIMRGYHRDPAATAAAIDGEGFLHTGDCGRIDADGMLCITGRLKELLKTSNGKYVCPVPIEQALATSPLVDLAMVVAEGRPYATALLFADLPALRRAAAQTNDQANLDDEACADATPVRAALDALVASVNAGLDHWQQIRRYAVIVAPPSVQEELTPTMKLRRHVVAQKYAMRIDALYRPQPDQPTPTRKAGAP